MPPPYRSVPLRSTDLPNRFKPSHYLRYSELPPTTKLAPHIRSLAWSATGVYLAQCVSSTIRVWNVERDGRAGGDPKARPSQGIEIKNAHGATETVEKVAFCPQKEGLLASVGSDKMLRLWDFSAGAAGGAGQGVVGAPAGPKANGPAAAAAATIAQYAVGECGLGDGGWSLTWHPSGDLVLVGRQDDIVQAITLEPVATPAISTTTTIPQTAAAAGTKQHYKLSAHDATPPRELHASASRPDLRSRNLNTLAFSNPGSELLCTTGDGRVHIYSWPHLQHLHTLTAHTHGSYAVAHSPAGNYIAVGGGDSLLTLWDTGTLQCVHALLEHEKGVREVSFSWDGAYVVGGAGKEARDNPDKAAVTAPVGPPMKGGGPPKKDDDEGNAGGLKIWAADTGEVVQKVETGKPVGCVAWHPWRYWLAYGGEEGGLRVLGVGGL